MHGANLWLATGVIALHRHKYSLSKTPLAMDKYICNVCDYIYNPEEGDPDGGIEPGTPFDEIPDTWVCPICGADKDSFALYPQ